MALAISALVPWAITPLLMLGGAYLCYEGFEKLAHRLLHSKAEDKQHHAEQLQAVTNPAVDMVAFEQDKIKGAIRTDFILSAEIIVITLGTVAAVTFAKQVAVLTTIALAMTIGVYGLVAGIVKLDDGGLYLSRRTGNGMIDRCLRATGRLILRTAPYLMKTLSIAGTAAMFLVGGGILVHGIPGAHDLLHHWAESLGALPLAGAMLQAMASPLIGALTGIVAGALVLAGVMLSQRAFQAIRS